MCYFEGIPKIYETLESVNERIVAMTNEGIKGRYTI